VWDATLGTAVGEPLRGHPGVVKSVAFSPDGTAIVSGSSDTIIRLWKTTTGELIRELTGDGGITSVAFTPDGTQIVCGSSNTIQRWDVDTGERIGEPLRGHEDWIQSVAVSRDGTLIASGSQDRTIRIWDSKTGASIGKPVEGHDDRVSSVTFSPDGAKIASGSYDQTIRLWSVKTQAMIGGPLKRWSWVESVAFSHDGAFLVSGSYDHTVRVWNAETGIEVCVPLEGHTDGVMSITWSPNGVHVVSGSVDHSVRLWNLADILVLGKVGQEHNSSSQSGAIYPKDQDDTISRLRPDITTQYPPHLFPSHTFDMQDGWILGPNKELLLWVPGINRSNLYTPSRSHILGVPPTELDFSNFKCGTEWTQCRESINTE